MLGAKIRQLREDLGITQEDLAERIGVNVLQIHHYEHGKNQPRAEVLARIAQALYTSSDYLLGLTDDPVPSGLSKDELSAKERAVIAAWRRGERFEAIKVIAAEE